MNNTGDPIDCFGLNQLYINDITKEKFKDIHQSIVENGFDDYSAAGLSSFLAFRYPILRNTMFKNISRLDSGEIIKPDDTGSEIQTVWRPVFEVNPPGSFESAKETTENLLIAAVKNLIHNKKRIGITLSGGLDSSLILAIVKKHFLDKEIYTYSCGFYGDDEFQYSRIVADLFSDRHTEFVLSEDDFFGKESLLPALIKQKCAPLHPNELGLAIAESKARKDLCDIVLCGEGADDIFGGFGQILRMYLNYTGDPDRFSDFFFKEYLYFSVDEIEKILKPEYFVNPVTIGKEVFNEKQFPQNIENFVFYFIQRVHTRGLIERGINALRFNSFEQGFPFINPELVNYVNALPFNYKIEWKKGMDENSVKGLNYRAISEEYDIPKYLLKKIAENYLPEIIIYRKKKGFPVPFEKWLSDRSDYDFNKNLFKNFDMKDFSGLKKFMLINLNTFVTLFDKYKR